jgi:hypothetical protein
VGIGAGERRAFADPLTRLAEFTLSPFAPLRAVRKGKANGLATLSPNGANGKTRYDN